MQAAPSDPSRPSKRELVALWLLALVAIRCVAPSGPLYWDSFAYAEQAITGRAGGLALGRPLFVLLSHLAATAMIAADAALESIEPALRAGWSLVAAAASPLVASLAASLGLSSSERRWAALCVALSPAMAHASGQVLTDGPAVTALVASTLMAVRAKDGEGGREALLWLGAGAMLGAAFVLREPSIVHALVLFSLVSLGPRGARSRSWVTASIGLLVLAGLSMVWAARQPGWWDTVRHWSASMRRERVEHPYTLRDAGAYVLWLFALGPLATLAAISQWTRPRERVLARSKAYAIVTIGGLVPMLGLALYQDISYSPRYLLGTMPFAVALVAGVALDRWARDRRRIALVAALLAAGPLVGGVVLSARERALRAAIDDLPARLAPELRASPDVVVVTGQLCPAVHYANALERERAQRERRPPRLARTVCPGWDWPSDLGRVLDAHLASGRVVVVDLREHVWVGPRQRAAREELARWASRRDASAIRRW